MRISRVFGFLCAVSVSFIGSVQAEESKVLDTLTILGGAKDRSVFAGSGSVIEGEELERAKVGFDDIHRILRRVPGVYIQEEDGYGLRPNIGLRGVPNERSSKITLMEDGILIAPAPYSAPSAYFFPVTGRMSGIEVVKGASQIEYGPYTTGGAINLLSRPVPEDFKLDADLAVGQNNLKKANVAVGNSWKYGGILLETYQIDSDGFKDLPSGADTGFSIEDYNIKARINTDPDKPFYQELTYKFGTYDQRSNETYVGLTDADFGADPFQRYAGSQLDNIDADHIQHHFIHYFEVSEGTHLTTTAYYNETQRNWYKLEKIGGVGTSSVLDNPTMYASELAYLKGMDSPDDTFSLRNNRRNYESKGIQTVLTTEFDLVGTRHTVETGVRFHFDEEDRFQEENGFRMDNGTLVQTSAGAPGSQANRIGSADAFAFFVKDTIAIDKLTVTPGLRFENINYTREDFGKSDPMRVGASLKRSDTDFQELIPGIGFHYQLTDTTGAFFGVHKGFSPPGPASSDGPDEEESIAYEWGARYADQQSTLAGEVVIFYSDYDNLLGADTLSSGGDGTGDLFNGGEVDVFGVEASTQYDFAKPFDLPFSIPARFNYTFTQAEFGSSFESDFFGSVADGDDVPYVPTHQLFLELGIVFEQYSFFVNGNFVDAMDTPVGSSGLARETDSYMVWDLLAQYAVDANVALYTSVQNVGDREYAVAYRPAGARPGLPLTVTGGVKLTF